MSAVHRVTVRDIPDRVFTRLLEVLGCEPGSGDPDPGDQMCLPPSMLPACRVVAVERPHVLVLERGGAVLHSVVLAPVPIGAEVVWTSASGAGAAAEAEGALAVLDVALGDRALRGCGGGWPLARQRSQAPPTVLDHVALDHTDLRTRFDQLCATPTRLRREAVTGLLAAVARHEAAESALLRPMLRGTAGGGAVARVLDRQEQRVAAESHAVITAAVREDPALVGLLRQLRSSVLDNCDAEETAAHPRLQAGCSPAVLEQLGRRYVAMTRVEVDLRGGQVGAKQP